MATSPGARPWQETDLQQHTWDQFLKACPRPCSHLCQQFHVSRSPESAFASMLTSHCRATIRSTLHFGSTPTARCRMGCGKDTVIVVSTLSWDEVGRIAQVDAPPYSIANNNVRLPLSFRAIPVTARHHDGALQYDTHNLYGLSHAAATYRALDTIYAGASPGKQM